MFTVFAAIYIDMAFEDNVVLRQGARLVGAEDVHGAKVLDGVEVFDDGLLTRHHHRALGEIGGDYHGQHLGREAHCHRDGKDERLHPVALGDAVDEKHDGHHDQHEADEQQTDPGDALVEGGGCAVARHALGYRAQVGMVACGKDYGCGRATHHSGTHEADVVEFDNTGTMTVST